MPIYEYECDKCGLEFEREQRMSEPPIRTCPKCKSRKVTKLISRSSFVLKGGGWYADGYADPKKKSEAGSSDKSESATSDKSESSSSDKGESASAGKSESASSGKSESASSASPSKSSDGAKSKKSAGGKGSSKSAA